MKEDEKDINVTLSAEMVKRFLSNNLFTFSDSHNLLCLLMRHYCIDERGSAYGWD